MESVNQHYFLDYTTEELMEVIRCQDEWSSFDYNLARELLQARGIELTDKNLSDINKARLEILSQPDTLPDYYLPAAYIFALLGGFFGFLMGLALYRSKKVMKDQSTVYRYSPLHRKHGLGILSLSTLAMIILTFFYVNR